jgi:hypothetical protein
MADDLVRRIRFDVTQWNLDRIHKLADTIARREKGVGDFLGLPERLRKEVLTLRGSANALIDMADQDFGGDVDAFLDDLGKLRDGLEGVAKTLRGETSKARQLQAELFEPLSDRPDVKSRLVNAAEALMRKLTLANYWEDRTECEALFAEYVELLRGIALRSARFGDEDLSIGDLFLIADGLPSVWGEIQGWRWQSVAVPSQIEQSRATEAAVLRVGFPEWTIWALPLLQHEFGHIAIKRLNLDQRGVDPAVLADALAVLAAGPAYACATLLLRLDPGLVDFAPRDAAVRSATIVNMLRAIADQANCGPVGQLAKRLEDEWRLAVRESGGVAEAFDEMLASSEWKDALELGGTAVPVVAAGNGRFQPYWIAKWGTVSGWADDLRQGKLENLELAEVDGKDEAKPSLNLVLNAAWLARVRPDGKNDANSVEVELIGKRAAERMLAYIRAPAQTKPTSLRG